jgi:hypothetical protein
MLIQILRTHPMGQPLKTLHEAEDAVDRFAKRDLGDIDVTYAIKILSEPRKLDYSPRGVPILTVDEKLVALATCIKDEAQEDAIGHLFDLLNYVAPKKTRSGTILADCYANPPTAVLRCAPTDAQQEGDPEPPHDPPEQLPEPDEVMVGLAREAAKVGKGGPIPDDDEISEDRKAEPSEFDSPVDVYFKGPSVANLVDAADQWCHGCGASIGQCHSKTCQNHDPERLIVVAADCVAPPIVEETSPTVDVEGIDHDLRRGDRAHCLIVHDDNEILHTDLCMTRADAVVAAREVVSMTEHDDMDAEDCLAHEDTWHDKEEPRFRVTLKPLARLVLADGAREDRGVAVVDEAHHSGAVEGTPEGIPERGHCYVIGHLRTGDLFYTHNGAWMSRGHARIFTPKERFASALPNGGYWLRKGKAGEPDTPVGD